MKSGIKAISFLLPNESSSNAAEWKSYGKALTRPIHTTSQVPAGSTVGLDDISDLRVAKLLGQGLRIAIHDVVVVQTHLFLKQIVHLKKVSRVIKCERNKEAVTDAIIENVSNISMKILSCS